MENSFRLYSRNAGSILEGPMFPEVTDGFDETLPPLPLGMAPVSFRSDPVPAGIYQIHICIKALKDADRIYLFTGRKQLRDILSLKGGQRLERIYNVSVMEIIPRFQENIVLTEHLFFTICTENPEDVQVQARWEPKKEGVTRIFLCGDSTVTDHASELPYEPGACYAAWGQDLPAFLEGSFAVENQAHCGLTTETFRQEGHFDIVKRRICKGDICLFQFGHNDQKLPHLLADREYPENLRRFVREIRESGAYPVLVTPLGRNIWSRDNTYLDLLKEHAQAVCRVAEQERVPRIDLHRFSVDFICKNGMEYCRSFFHPEDYTHTNEYGACFFGEYVAKRLAGLFPEILQAREQHMDFTPPGGLWEKLGLNGRKNTSQTQREQFDNMEKSTGELLKAIREAGC